MPCLLSSCALLTPLGETEPNRPREEVNQRSPRPHTLPSFRRTAGWARGEKWVKCELLRVHLSHKMRIFVVCFVCD